MLFNWIICSGAAADFQQATTIATSMVKRFGMSEKVKFSIQLDAFDLIFLSLWDGRAL